jgi:hypothetical protein
MCESITCLESSYLGRLNTLPADLAWAILYEVCECCVVDMADLLCAVLTCKKGSVNNKYLIFQLHHTIRRSQYNLNWNMYKYNPKDLT